MEVATYRYDKVIAHFHDDGIVDEKETEEIVNRANGILSRFFSRNHQDKKDGCQKVV